MGESCLSGILASAKMLGPFAPRGAGLFRFSLEHPQQSALALGLDEEQIYTWVPEPHHQRRTTQPASLPVTKGVWEAGYASLHQNAPARLLALTGLKLALGTFMRAFL